MLIMTEERRAKLSAAFKGKHHSEEAKMKMSLARKKFFENNSPARQHISEVMSIRLKGNKNTLGHRLSEEHKRKISEGGKGKKRSLETRARISKAMKERPMPWMIGDKNISKRPEVAAKKSASLKKVDHYWTRGKNSAMKRPEVRAKFSGENHIFKRNPDALRNCMRAQHAKPNSKEFQLNSILQSIWPKEWQFVGDGKVVIEGFCPDFINVNGKKLIIELFGDYWHNRIGAKEKDQRRIKAYKSKGFDTMVIWENELSQSSNVIKKITNFIERR